MQTTNFHPFRALIRTMILAAVLLNALAAAAWIFGEQFTAVCFALFALCVAIVAVIFVFAGRRSARKIRLLIEGNDLLAHWEYSGNVFTKYIHAEFKRQLSNARITAAVFLIAGPVIGIAEEGLSGWRIGIALGTGLGLFAYLLAYGMARDFRKRGMTPPHDAYLSSTSVYLNGMFVEWSTSGSEFISGEIRNDDAAGMPSIYIVYSIRGRYGKETKEAHVPIPEGKIHEAQQIIARWM